MAQSNNISFNKVLVLKTMNDTAREKFVAEISRLRSAIVKTRSPYLKRDYLKAIKHMELELTEYDKFKKDYYNNQPIIID